MIEFELLSDSQNMMGMLLAVQAVSIPDGFTVVFSLMAVIPCSQNVPNVRGLIAHCRRFSQYVLLMVLQNSLSCRPAD
jgi:hypothetical protein